jgi:hypothetical protein
VFGGGGDDKDKKPDYVMLCRNVHKNLSRWAVLEMKGRISHPRRIAQQLQEGANIIAKNMRFNVSDYPKTIYAFVVRDKHVRSSDFAQRYVKFFGRSTRIVVIKSHSRLSSILN